MEFAARFDLGIGRDLCLNGDSFEVVLATVNYHVGYPFWCCWRYSRSCVA